jgi:lactoylglutathione lyase
MKSCSVLGIGHVGISVKDKQVSKKFYTEVLGFEVAWEYHSDTKDLLFLKNGNCVIELLQTDEPLEDGQLNHLSILVDDVDRAYAELKEKGVQFETDIKLDAYLYPNGERYAMFRGPDNERLQIEQIL